MTERLTIDEKWSIGYEPDNNDRPVMVYRYGVEAHDLLNDAFRMNFIDAMFYELLENSRRINHNAQ